MSPAKPNPFAKKLSKQAEKENPFLARSKKKRMLSTTDSARKDRLCKFRKGMTVRMTWQQYPELGGKRKMSIGTVLDVQWTDSGATVVFQEKSGPVIRHALFAPGNATMKVVKG